MLTTTLKKWHLPPAPKPLEPKSIAAEDSLSLRIWVQALVIVGIIATDVAAATTNSVWAVPLSVVGAAWSWQSRRRRNVVVKFGIAIGMIAALVLFLGRLVSQAEDSRVMLTELLIQLQVLHSFDLPRRKDLGYSSVIGLILLGVAATLSQTTFFGLFLLVFLAIALPVLVFDYRSRLGLETGKGRGQAEGKRQRVEGRGQKRDSKHQARWLTDYMALFVAIVALGLVIFALTPRLPGYQLRTFPVSGAINVQGEFDGQRVINPGYVRGAGTPLQQGGEGIVDQVFDPNFYYGFSSEINQNLRGTLVPEVLMRVRSQAAGFWRVLAFDQYTGQGWKVSRNPKTGILKRSPWNYQFVLPKTASLGASQEVVQTYTIVSPFTNLIPSLNQARDLYFPTQEVAIDPEGGLRSPLVLPEGLTYTVISDVPYRDRTLLRQASTTYPAEIRDLYLQVPVAIQDQVRQQAQTLLATANRPLTQPYEQALYLAQEIKKKYNLQSDLPLLSQDEDLVSAFLFKFGGGYPDHFSTVLTIMLRSLGIPARLITGLGTGEFNPFTGLYIVHNTDGYALTEVYFPNYGWFSFDPIPGHEPFPTSVEVDQTFTVLQQFWNWVAGWLPSPVAGLFAQVFALLGNLMSGFLGLFSRGLGGVISAVIILLGTALCGWLGWQGWQIWRYRHWLGQLPPTERLYQQMLSWLATQGVSKQSWQTPLEYLQQIRQTTHASWVEGVAEISGAYMDWRYGGQQPNLRYLQQQLRNLQKIQGTQPLAQVLRRLNRKYRRFGLGTQSDRSDD